MLRARRRWHARPAWQGRVEFRRIPSAAAGTAVSPSPRARRGGAPQVQRGEGRAAPREEPDQRRGEAGLERRGPQLLEPAGDQPAARDAVDGRQPRARIQRPRHGGPPGPPEAVVAARPPPPQIPPQHRSVHSALRVAKVTESGTTICRPIDCVRAAEFQVTHCAAMNSF